MASEPSPHQPAGGQPISFQGQFSVNDSGRQHVGNVYNKSTFHYEVQSRVSDEKLVKDDRNQVLLKAAAEGQTERVAYLINRLGVDLDYKDEQGFTVLHHAALNGFEDTVATLRSAGSDVNAESVDLGTPLHQAARKGRVNVVRQLLSRESTIVNVSSRTVGTPLHCAASIGNCEIASALIQKGADVHLKSPITVGRLSILDTLKPGQSWLIEVGPLFSAMYTQQVAMMELLLEKGASYSATTTVAQLLNQDTFSQATGIQALVNTTVLIEAAALGYTDICRVLLEKGAPVDAPGPNGKTALHVAAQRGNRDCVELFLRKKVNLERSDDESNTALFSAAWAGHKDCVEKLIRAGSSVEAKCKYGDTAMHAAASGGYADTVRTLCGYGADINSRNADRTTPLHLAARYGRGDIVRFLLGLKADKDARDNNGQTPLHVSTQELQLSSVEVLLDNDVDVNIRDRADRTALDVLDTRQDAGDSSFIDNGSDIEKIKWMLLHHTESNALSTQTPNRPRPEVRKIRMNKTAGILYSSEVARNAEPANDKPHSGSAGFGTERGRRLSGPEREDYATRKHRRSRSPVGVSPPRSAGVVPSSTRNFGNDYDQGYYSNEKTTSRKRSSGQPRSPARASAGVAVGEVRSAPKRQVAPTRWADTVLGRSLNSTSDAYSSSPVKESPRRQPRERFGRRRSSGAGEAALGTRLTGQATLTSSKGAVPALYRDRPPMASLASQGRYSTVIRVRGRSRSRSRSAGRSGSRGRSQSRNRSQDRNRSRSRGRSRSRSQVRSHSQPQGRSRSRSGGRLNVARKDTAVSTDRYHSGRTAVRGRARARIF